RSEVSAVRGRQLRDRRQDQVPRGPRGRRGLVLAFLAAVIATASVLTASHALSTPTSPQPPAASQNWVTAWGASPVVGSDIPGSTCPAGTGLTDQTVRNVVFLSAGGDSVRVRLSNTFGTQDMLIGDATVAVQSAGADAVRGTVR